MGPLSRGYGIRICLLLSLQVDSSMLKQNLDGMLVCQPMDNGDQDEQVPTEESVQEYIEHIVQSLENINTDAVKQ